MCATKNVNGFGNLTYEERIQRLDLQTLIRRRKRGDMIDVYKHAATYEKVALSSSMTFSNRPSRKHGYQIRRVEAGDGTRSKQQNSFYYRTPAT